MPSIVNEAGEEVCPDGELEMTREQLSRTRDLIIIRLRRMRLSFRDIGQIMNITADRAYRRHEAIPADVRDYYGPLELG